MLHKYTQMAGGFAGPRLPQSSCGRQHQGKSSITNHSQPKDPQRNNIAHGRTTLLCVSDVKRYLSRAAFDNFLRHETPEVGVNESDATGWVFTIKNAQISSDLWGVIAEAPTEAGTLFICADALLRECSFFSVQLQGDKGTRKDSAALCSRTLGSLHFTPFAS